MYFWTYLQKCHTLGGVKQSAQNADSIVVYFDWCLAGKPVFLRIKSLTIVLVKLKKPILF